MPIYGPLPSLFFKPPISFAKASFLSSSVNKIEWRAIDVDIFKYNQYVFDSVLQSKQVREKEVRLRHLETINVNKMMC